MTRRKLWEVKGRFVCRAGKPIAEFFTIGDKFVSGKNKLAWEGMGLRREGLRDMDHLVEDVKYFYRYPQRRQTILTFRSGRKVVVE